MVLAFWPFDRWGVLYGVGGKGRLWLLGGCLGNVPCWFFVWCPIVMVYDEDCGCVGVFFCCHFCILDDLHGD